MGFGLSVATVDFTDKIRQTIAREGERIPAILDQAGRETIEQLRALTSERRPPVRAGEGDRFAHLGHWADITGHLSESYGYTVERNAAGDYTLVLRNRASYAASLEGREAFWVLSGVADPDGPVWGAIENAVRQLAPNWTVGPLQGVKRA